MGEVVNLLDRKPHLAGNAKCLACAHEWVAVSPTGVAALECPGCGLHKGVFKSLCEPSDGVVWHCKCGCDTFYIDRSGVCCLVCAAPQRGWE